jgi:hypothetical protein
VGSVSGEEINRGVASKVDVQYASFDPGMGVVAADRLRGSVLWIRRWGGIVSGCSVCRFLFSGWRMVEGYGLVLTSICQVIYRPITCLASKLYGVSQSLGPANEPSQASSPNADLYILQLLIFNTVLLPYQQPFFAQSARHIQTCSTFSHDEAQSSLIALPCTLRRHCFQNRTRPAQHFKRYAIRNPPPCYNNTFFGDEHITSYC